MAHRIFYVLFPSDSLSIPIDIVHFKEKNGIIIPLLIEDEIDYEKLIYHSQYCNNSKDYLSNLHTFEYEYPTRKVIDLLRNNQIQTFGIIGYKETLEIPDNLGNPLLFVNGEKKTIPDKKINEKKEQYVHMELNIDYSFLELIGNENKYKSYYNAERYYFAELEKNCS